MIFDLFIRSIVGAITICIMFYLIVTILMFADRVRLWILKLFYSTKIGSVFERYEVFERTILILSAIILLLGCYEMGRRMIEVLF